MRPAASPSATARISGRRRSSRTRNSAALGWPQRFRPKRLQPRTKGGAAADTTLVVVATDAMLTKAQAQTPRGDGAYRHAACDLSGAYSARRRCRVRRRDRQEAAARSAYLRLTALGAIAANVLARAIARAVYEADRPACSRRAAVVERQIRITLPSPGAEPACAACVIAIGRYSSCKDHAVPSSVIRDASYNVDTTELGVTFVSGRVYVYAGVPQDVLQRLCSASSERPFFNQKFASTTTSGKSLRTESARPRRAPDRKRRRRRSPYRRPAAR